jgi:hypothetical protein
MATAATAGAVRRPRPDCAPDGDLVDSPRSSLPCGLTVGMAGKIRSPGRVPTINLRHGHDGFWGRKA